MHKMPPTRFISKDSNACSSITSWLATAELCSGSFATVIRSLSKQEHKQKLILAPNSKYPLDLLGFGLTAQRNRGNKKTIMTGSEPRVNANKVRHSGQRVSFSRKDDVLCYSPPSRSVSSKGEQKAEEFKQAEDPIGIHEQPAAKPMFSALFATLKEADVRKKELKPVKARFWKTFHESNVRKQLPTFKPQWNVLYSTLESSVKRKERLANVHSTLFKILANSNERRESDAAFLKAAPLQVVKQKRLSKTIRRKKSSKEDTSKEAVKPSMMAVPVSPSALNTSAGEDGAYCSDSSIGQGGLFFSPSARVA